jgi:hypothetical protein
MNKDVGDDGAQGILVLGPVIENGPAIKEDHVGERSRMSHLLAMGEAHALEQAEQVELAFGLHVAEHVIVRKVLDPDDDVAGQIMKGFRQARISICRERIQFLERWRFEDVQFMQRKPVAWQRSNPSAVIAFTVV